MVGIDGAEPKTDAQPADQALAERPHGNAHVPSRRGRRLVKGMIAGGMTQKAVAALMNISEDTLQKHYRMELDHGQEAAMSLLYRSLYRRALHGDTTAAIFLLKSRGGFRDRDPLNVQVNNNTLKVDAPQDAKQIEDAVFKALSQLRPSKQLASAKQTDN